MNMTLTEQISHDIKNTPIILYMNIVGFSMPWIPGSRDHLKNLQYYTWIL